MLKAHRLMMDGLIDENGQFRTMNVGIKDGRKLVHPAPPAALVPELVSNLISWYTDSKAHPLVKSAVFHYEFEFIHPFSDGNGRIGRMWHTMLLGAWKDLFYWVPIEELIQHRQNEYYEALSSADHNADSSIFVELMLEIIRDSLKVLSVSDQVSDQVTPEITRLLDALGNYTLSTAEIMNHLGLSHRPTFRKNYLNPALSLHLIEPTVPDKPRSSKQKYRKHHR